MMDHHRITPSRAQVYAYNGQYPGRTIEATIGNPVFVQWINRLPQNYHLFPVDTDVVSMTPQLGQGLGRMVTHLHGGCVAVIGRQLVVPAPRRRPPAARSRDGCPVFTKQSNLLLITGTFASFSA